uniref:Uncharacterized protein n=1 Tax=Ixodes ricinus TaxID=34613 RepID=A0A6B0V4V0_IXORI
MSYQMLFLFLFEVQIFSLIGELHLLVVRSSATWLEDLACTFPLLTSLLVDPRRTSAPDIRPPSCFVAVCFALAVRALLKLARRQSVIEGRELVLEARQPKGVLDVFVPSVIVVGVAAIAFPACWHRRTRGTMLARGDSTYRHLPFYYALVGLEPGRMQEFPEGGVRCLSAYHMCRNPLPLSFVLRPKFYTSGNQEGGQDIRTPPLNPPLGLSAFSARGGLDVRRTPFHISTGCSGRYEPSEPI